MTRALTVPILPEHVWADRTDAAEFPGIDVPRGTTDAVVTDNIPPTGSGPFAFEDRTERDGLVLERFDDHFTLRDDVDLPEPTVETLRLIVEARSTAAIQRVERDEGDVTVSPLQSYSLENVTEPDGVELLESPSWAFYHLGFNARNAPFSNPYVRRTVARLLDKTWIASDVFKGRATPVATPVTGEWVPEDLEWNGVDPEVPFFGTDGELEVDAARTAFEKIGFTYDEEGRLLARN